MADMVFVRQMPVALGLVAFTLFAAAGLRHVHGLQASGDEPHYLLMAQSLWQEHDLDLRDNLERGDYGAYVPGALSPHYGWPRRDGRPYPAHSPGLPLLIAPAYAAGGRAGVVLLLAALGALLVVEVGRWARLLDGSETAVALAALLIAISPVFFYSFHVYTEVPSALAAWCALRLVWQRAGPGGAVLAALLASSLVWLHFKMVPAAVVVAVVAAFRLEGKARVGFFAVAATMALLFGSYLHSVYGNVARPIDIYGTPSQVAATATPVRAFVGLLFDRSFGLLPYAPAFVAAFAAWGVAWRRRSGPATAAVLFAAAMLLPALLWRQWWGGMCPPARLLVPALPLLAWVAALRTSERPRGLAHWLVALIVLQAGLVLFAVWRPEARLLLNRTDRPTRLWSALSGDFPLADYLPALAGVPDWTAPTLIWLGALGLLFILDAASQRSDPVDRLFRRPVLAVVWAVTTVLALSATL